MPTIPRSCYPAEFVIDQRPVSVIDLAGFFVDANEAFHLQVGLPRTDVLGGQITDIWDIDPFGPELALEQRLAADGMVLVDVGPAAGCPDAPAATLQFLPMTDAGRWVACSVSVVTEAVKREKRALSLDSAGFQLSFDQVEVGMLITGVDGYAVKCNPAMVRIYHRTLAEIAETDAISMIHPDDRQGAIEQGLRLLNGEIESYSRELRLLAGDGSPVWVHETTTIVRDGDGNPLHFLSQYIDIGDRKRVEAERNRALDELTRAMEALRDSEAKIKFLVDGTPVPLIEIDADYVICGANAALEGLLGRPPIGVSMTEVVHPDDLEELGRSAALVASDTDWRTEFRVVRPDGMVRWVRSHGRVHLDDDAVFRTATATWSDVTETKQAEELLRLQASTDSLTGLPNRATFFDRLGNALARSARSGGLAVLFVDLDHFKPVNDRWGHEAGDELLVHVARRLATCVRDGDTVARIGGDEFVILAEPVVRSDDAAIIGQRIVDALREPFRLTCGTASISASVGLARGASGIEPRELVHRADLAAYQAKAAGRSQLTIAS